MSAQPPDTIHPLAVMKPAAFLTAAVFLGTLLALFYFSDKGLNITDEGNHLAACRHPRENIAFASSYFYFIGPLFKSLHYNVIGLRRAGIVLLAGSGLFLGTALARLSVAAGVARAGYPLTLLCAGFCGLGALMHYSWTMYTPNYNWLNALSLTTLAGLMTFTFASFIDKNPVNLTGRIITAGSGLCIALAFFVKFTSGILFLGLYGLFFAKLRLGAKHGFLFLLSLLAFMSGYFIYFQSFQQWGSMLQKGLSVSVQIGHNPAWLIKYYYYNLNSFLADPALFMTGFLALAFAAFKETCQGKTRRLCSAACLALFAFLIYGLLQRGYFLGGMDRLNVHMQFYLLWLLVCSGYAVFLMFWREKIFPGISGFLDFTIFGAVLLMLPLAGCIGTGNHLTSHILLYLSPLFAVFLMVLGLALKLSQKPLIPFLIVAVISLFACGQIVTAPLLSPCDLHTGILRQTVPTLVGDPSTSLKLDVQTSRFINTLRSIASESGFKPGDDILAFFDMPGLVYALGGISPGTSWWTGPWVKNNDKANALILKWLSRERLRRAFILQNYPDEAMPSLIDAGIKFPRDYTLCGTLVWPKTGQEVKLWRPVGSSGAAIKRNAAFQGAAPMGAGTTL